jgi:hypothetical protein
MMLVIISETSMHIGLVRFYCLLHCIEVKSELTSGELLLHN